MSVHLTPAARKACGDPEALRRAVSSALGGVDRPQEVDFMAFRCEGAPFALSARLVIDVDHFPHRVPDRIIRRSGG